MAIVIGVRFKKPGKVYYFDPCGLDVKADDPVVVETVRGVEMGECARAPYEVPDEEIVPPLRKVVRIATDEDISQVEQNRENERRAYDICQEKIAQHKLEMKLVDVEYAFDCSKIIFYFTADGRVDFRDAGQGSGRGVPHAHRAAPDRRARRGEDARRARPVRAAHLLRHVPGRFPAGIHQNGERAEPFA